MFYRKNKARKQRVLGNNNSVAILNTCSGKSLFEKIGFGPKTEEAEEVSYAYICRRKIPGACFDIPKICLLVLVFPLPWTPFP